MKIVILIIVSLIVLSVITVVSLNYWADKSNPEYIVKYIKNHPEQSSIVIQRNGDKIVDVRSDQEMPLASTVKILIAIEYAKQVADGRIQSNESVSLQQVEQFYIANLDGGAHSSWIKAMEDQNKVINDTVPLEEVAKGMINFSSNANTEYLMMRLGLENINQNIVELGLTNHQEIYPFVSSLLIPYELMKNTSGLKAENIIKAKEKIRTLTYDEYRTEAQNIHEKLQNDVDGSYKKEANILGWYDKDFDRINSELFIKSRTRDYVLIVEKINSRDYFSEATYKHLETVMEGLMTNPKNQEWLAHAGKKGGSTAFILTDTLYATDKEGNRTELAVFFNDLDPIEFRKLRASLNEFELKILSDKEFLGYVETELK